MRNPNPVTIRGQLNAYYDAQGLDAKSKRKAIQHDMRRIAFYVKRDKPSTIEVHGYAYTRAEMARVGLGIAGAFLFHDIKEGPEYWANRAAGFDAFKRGSWAC